MSVVTITPAKGLDLDQLRQVAQRHLQAPQEWGDKSYDDPDLCARMAESWHRRAGEGAFYIGAVLGERGTVEAFIWADKIEEPEPHAMIHSLWVAAERRRQGIARHLKAALEDWGREQGLGWIETLVHSRNEGMLALNRQMGYADTFLKQRKDL